MTTRPINRYAAALGVALHRAADWLGLLPQAKRAAIAVLRRLAPGHELLRSEREIKLGPLTLRPDGVSTFTGTFRTVMPGRLIEMSGPMTCGRRFDGLPVSAWHVAPVHEDFWRTGGGLVTQGAVGRSCSYCGSLHPDALMEKLRAGWTLEGSDKPYKWYLRDLDGRTVAKFYTQHLPRRAAEELLRGLGDGVIKHSLYVRPWLPSLASSAPAWLIGPVR